jgi:predicted kinase
MKLTCMRGYPGAGKSTIARTLPGVIVSRDDLRMQMYGTYDIGQEGEEAVTVAERAMVRALLRAGNDVVVDAMHVNPRYLKFWAKVSSEMGADFEVHDVPTPAWDCAVRDAHRDNKKVGIGVINKIAKKWPENKWPLITAPPKIEVEPYVPSRGLPSAVIVDIDGTLAHTNGRSPYDYTKVKEDTVDPIIRDLVGLLWESGDNVLIMSGRDDTCSNDTYEWLCDAHVPVDEFLLRPPGARDHNGNKLPDWVVKLDLFNKHVRHHYNVRLVLDDRNQVVNLWRKLGLKCLQVADGDF